MKKVTVKFIGVQHYLVKDDSDQEQIKQLFEKDCLVLPDKWRKNIEPVMFAKYEAKSEEE